MDIVDGATPINHRSKPNKFVISAEGPGPGFSLDPRFKGAAAGPEGADQRRGPRGSEIAVTCQLPVGMPKYRRFVLFSPLS